MIEYLPALIAAWSVQLVGVLSPGPAVAMIAGVGVARGVGAVLITATGIASASIVLSVVTVVGLTAVLAQMAEVMVLLRIAGAAFLAWLAIGAFKRAATPPEMLAPSAMETSAWRTGLKGFLLQVSNPKAMFFWLAIAALGGLATAPLSVIMLFCAGAFVNSFIGHAAWGLVFAAPPVRRGYARARRWIEATLGIAFSLFAIKLALQRT